MLRIELTSIPSIALDKIVRMSLFHGEVLNVALVVVSPQRALHGTKNETKSEIFQRPVSKMSVQALEISLSFSQPPVLKMCQNINSLDTSQNGGQGAGGAPRSCLGYVFSTRSLCVLIPWSAREQLEDSERTQRR